MTHDENILYSQALHAINTTLSGLRCVAANLATAIEAMEEGPAQEYASQAASGVIALQAYLIECTVQQGAGASRITYEGGNGHQADLATPADDAASVVVH